LIDRRTCQYKLFEKRDLINKIEKCCLYKYMWWWWWGWLCWWWW